VKVLKIGESNIDNLGSPATLASGLFGTTYSILLYKIKSEQELDIKTLYREYANIIFPR